MKFLHTMIRVGNLEKSIKFYTEVLGLKFHRQTEYPEGEFTLAFLGYGSDTEPFLELTHNWGTDSYDLGDGYGHMAFGVEDIYATCEKIDELGITVDLKYDALPPPREKDRAIMDCMVELGLRGKELQSVP